MQVRSVDGTPVNECGRGRTATQGATLRVGDHPLAGSKLDNCITLQRAARIVGGQSTPGVLYPLERQPLRECISGDACSRRSNTIICQEGCDHLSIKADNARLL